MIASDKTTIWLFDCDGTLLNDDKGVTEATRKKIREIANTSNNMVVFASGRSYEGVKDICRKLNMLDAFQYYIYFNGCQIIDNRNPNHPKVLTNTLMDKKTSEVISKLAKENNIPCYMITPEKVMIEQPVKEASTEAERNFEPTVQQNLTNIGKGEQVVKVVLSLPEDPARMQRFYESLSDVKLSDGTPLKDQYTIIRPDDHNMEFLSRDAGKAPAMLSLKYNIFHADRTVSFGDAGNDLDMIEQADYGIAMGNAVKECKEVAYMVTKDNNHDGIVAAVDELEMEFERIAEKAKAHQSFKSRLSDRFTATAVRRIEETAREGMNIPKVHLNSHRNRIANIPVKGSER